MVDNVAVDNRAGSVAWGRGVDGWVGEVLNLRNIAAFVEAPLVRFECIGWRCLPRHRRSF